MVGRITELESAISTAHWAQTMELGSNRLRQRSGRSSGSDLIFEKENFRWMLLKEFKTYITNEIRANQEERQEAMLL